MKLPIHFDLDVPNFIHLFDEQGYDVSALLSEYAELDRCIPQDQRAASPAWRQFEEKILAIDAQLPSTDPSTLDAILAARPAHRCDRYTTPPSAARIASAIDGAWHGRIAGCVLGKPVECLMAEKDSRATLHSLLRDAGEYPLTDFIPESVIVPYWRTRFASNPPKWFAEGRGRECLRGHITFAARDDDTDYTVLALELLEEFGAALTPDNVLDTLIHRLPYGATYTAERVAYRNRLLGLSAADCARFLNPYREWIGAQIRADAYGYVSPGRPAEAARLAWNDASTSHTHNGIYGAMWTAAALAAAFVETDPAAVIQRGLEQIPQQSRFSHHLRATLAAAARNGDNFEATFADIHARLGTYHCVHCINNACLVVAALVHGRGDFGRTICIAVMGGLDTDCNGATAGSIFGALFGKDAIPPRWYTPFNDRLDTALSGCAALHISDLVTRTIALANRMS